MYKPHCAIENEPSYTLLSVERKILLRVYVCSAVFPMKDAVFDAEMMKFGAKNVIKIGTTWKFFGFFILIFVSCIDCVGAGRVFTNSFYVRLHQPGVEHAHKVAKRHGLMNVGPVR